VLTPRNRVQSRSRERAIDRHEIPQRQWRKNVLRTVGDSVHVVVIAIGRDDDRRRLFCARATPNARDRDRKRERAARYSSQPH
jgi:hypothetical protein